MRAGQALVVLESAHIRTGVRSGDAGVRPEFVLADHRMAHRVAARRVRVAVTLRRDEVRTPGRDAGGVDGLRYAPAEPPHGCRCEPLGARAVLNARQGLDLAQRVES